MFPDGSEVELLDTRPPRPGRLRRQVLFGAVVVAAVGAVIVARTGNDDPAKPAHRSTPAAPSSGTSVSAPAPSLGNAGIISADPAFARVGDTVYALDARRLLTIDLNTGATSERASTGVTTPADRYTMLADPAAHRLWLVAATDIRTVVDFLDPTTLAVTGHHQARGTFMDAAVLDGRLFLATTTGVEVISPAAETAPLRSPSIGGQPLAIGADPTRHRILVVFVRGRRLVLGAWRVGQRRPDVVAPAAIGKGDVGTAGGRIWAAGFGPHAVMTRLDPSTLRAVRHSPVELEAGVGAVVVDAGARHLLVRSGGSAVIGSAGMVSDLWCIDAGTGAIVRRWSPAAGTALLTAHGVVLLPSDAPMQRLPSGACRG